MPLLPVTYPDAQLVVVGYLRPLLAPIPVGVRVPEQRPATFVTVRRSGGVAQGRTDHARIDLYAWAASDIAAYDLANAVRRHLAVIGAQDATVAAVQEFAGPIPATDESNQPRWLVTYEISLRGSTTA